MSRAAAVALLVVATGIWGATFPVVKGALADSGPLTFLALRFGVAALVLLPLLRSRGRPRQGTGRAALCGVALFAGYLCQTTGLQTTTPARSAFITALSVVLVPLLQPLVGLGRPGRRAWAGASLALVGLAVLLRPDASPPTVGDLLTVGCAFAFAAHVLLLQWTVRLVPATVASAVQVTATAALAIPAAGFESWHFEPTARLAVAVAVCALLATVFAFWVMTAAQRVLSAALTAVVLAFEPVAAALASLALGEDAPTLQLAIGGTLVVAAVLLATGEQRSIVVTPIAGGAPRP